MKYAVFCYEEHGIVTSYSLKPYQRYVPDLNGGSRPDKAGLLSKAAAHTYGNARLGTKKSD